MTRSSWAPQPAAALGALVLITYVLVARGLHDLYPFSTFSMYSGHATTAGSRIVARDAGGRIRELSAYDRWSCPPEAGVQEKDAEACGEVYRIDYLDREAREYLSEHRTDRAAPGSEPVEVVRRIWQFGGAAPVTRDCPILRCSAVPR